MDLERDYGVSLETSQNGGLQVNGEVLARHAEQVKGALRYLRFVWRSFPPALRRPWTIRLLEDGTVETTREARETREEPRGA